MNRAQRVTDVMNPDIMTVADEMTTGELVRFLTEREISGAPVVDGQGRLIGVVSMTDIGRHLAEPSDFASLASLDFYRDTADEMSPGDCGHRYGDEREVMVRDVMTPAVYQVPATALVVEAARIMVDNHIHRLIVTRDKEPVGILTSIDLLRVLAEQP
jgi:CBS domain-containing protein